MGDLDDAGFREQPLVGRDEVLTAVLRSLVPANGAGSVVVGESGLGKTAIADTVEALLGKTQPTFRISGSPSLSTVPFGALAPYVSSLPVADITSSLAVLHTVMAAVEQAASGRNTPVLVVDDAHDLDDASTSVIAQVVTSGAAQLLALANPEQGLPAEIAALWNDGLLVRHDLEPLTADEVHELCSRILGGGVLRSVSAVLAHASSGNPMFVGALVEQYRHSGHLVERNGVWFFAGDPPVAGLELADLIRARTRRLSAAEREALELAALAEPIELAVLLKACPPSVVDNLEQQRLISVSGEDGRAVRTAHRIYGEVIRSWMPTGRKLAARQRVVDLLDPEPASVDRLLRYVGWALDCRASVPQFQLIRAARLANDLLDPAFALRAAQAVTDPELQMAAWCQMAQAHYARGDLQRAAKLLEPVMGQATDFHTIATAALLSSQLRLHQGGVPGEIEEDARSWREAIDRLSRGSSDPEVLSAAAVGRIGSRLLRLHALNLAGDYRSGEAELRSIAECDSGTPETRMVALSLLGELLGSTGRPVSGAGMSARAMESIETNEQSSSTFYQFAVSRYLTSLVNGGNWDEVHDLMTQYLQHSRQGMVYQGGLVNLATGRVLVRQGLLHSGLNQLRPAIEALRESDREQLLPLALGLGAYAAAFIGEREQAQQYVADLKTVPYPGQRQGHLLGRAHAAAAQAILPGGGHGITELRRIGQETRDSSMLSVEQLVLELQFRVGDLGELERQVTLAARNEGVEARLQYGFASALLNQDPESLAAVARQAAEARYFLIQADCLLHASALFNSRGERRKGRYAAQQLETNPALREGVTTRKVRSSNDAAGLTPRERDIAAYAIDGKTNREIANALAVSVRTVEGHLYRIFAKLGIDRRSDLSNFHITSDN